MLGQMRAGDQNEPPEVRFASQLQQLASMGFVDQQANVQAGCHKVYRSTQMQDLHFIHVEVFFG